MGLFAGLADGGLVQLYLLLSRSAVSRSVSKIIAFRLTSLRRSRPPRPTQLECDRGEHQGFSDKRAGPERLVKHGRTDHGADKRRDIGVGTHQWRRRAFQ